MGYMIALDQGTTSSRALLFDKQCRVVDLKQLLFQQLFPHPGWVEHDPMAILSTQIRALHDVLETHHLGAHDIRGIGITNQRETTILWNKRTGLPVANAIVWQCRRTEPIIRKICSSDVVRQRIKKTTGLVPDPYFSASKIKWLLDHTPGARKLAEEGDLLFGTVDSWLVWNLTGGRVHATDYTNASRTMLFDIRQGAWDPWLCDLFSIPMQILPEVRRSSGSFGTTAHKVPAAFHDFVHIDDIPEGIPIMGVAGDQQSALFGQCCTHEGQAKNTYGTGCFLLMNTGGAAISSQHNLITTIAASCPDVPHIEYALEGSVFMAGALMQWLRDGLCILDDVAESQTLAESVSDTQGVYIVPAFTGLGAPYWDPDARGAVYGLTRGTTKAHFVRAALESLAYQVDDLVQGMEEDSGIHLRELNVDGGACNNDFLMQFQSDMLHVDLHRPENVETTAAGAAYLAGLACGFWKNMDEIRQQRAIEHIFHPMMSDAHRKKLLQGWHQCIARTRSTYPHILDRNDEGNQ